LSCHTIQVPARFLFCLVLLVLGAGERAALEKQVAAVEADRRRFDDWMKDTKEETRRQIKVLCSVQEWFTLACN